MHEIKWFICIQDPQIDDLEVRIQRSQGMDPRSRDRSHDPGVRNHPFWMVSAGLCHFGYVRQIGGLVQNPKYALLGLFVHNRGPFWDP